MIGHVSLTWETLGFLGGTEHSNQSAQTCLGQVFEGADTGVGHREVKTTQKLWLEKRPSAGAST